MREWFYLYLPFQTVKDVVSLHSPNTPRLYFLIGRYQYKCRVLKAGIGEYLKRKVLQIGKFHPEVEIIEVNTDLDHIHILVSIPPKMSVSQVVRMIKANTGSALRRKFSFLDKVYWGVSGIWSIGYFVSTVGINEATISKLSHFLGD